LVKTGANLFRFLFLSSTASLAVGKFIVAASKKPLFKKIVINTFILPLYEILFSSKKLIYKFYGRGENKRFLLLFSKRYLVHIALIAIALPVVAANLNAYEVRSDDFETSILASLSINEDLGLIEEEGPIINKPIRNYLDPNAVEPQQQETDGEESSLPTTAAGSAIIRQIISTTEAETRQRDKIASYTVEEGDNINYIAKKFGLSVNTMLWANNLTSYSIIRPGDKLTILPSNGLVHKIIKGDTLSKIAKKYNAESEKIIEVNKLASADDLTLGENLIIPNGVKPATPVYSLRTNWSPAPASAAAIKGSGSMLWPSTCRRITQYFGWRHSGIDIACPRNSAIYAADSGTVIKAQGGWNGGYGIYIIIDHGNGLQTLYGHLSKLYVKSGDQVNKGDAIGAEGSTGRSTGPHVHFEVRQAGYRKNPLSYIK